MTHRLPRRAAAFALAAALLFAAGCRKGADEAAVDLNKAPGEVKSAFAGAAAPLKQAADEAAQELSSGEYAGSMARISDLSSVPDLTPEQRKALGEAQSALLQKLSAAAAAGDAKAAEAMAQHRARK